MFEGEKTIVFWIGLVILGLASVGLFGILWIVAVWNGYMDAFRMLKQAVPIIVGGVVFILIGFYMMKSGVKKEAVVQPTVNQEPERNISNEAQWMFDTQRESIIAWFITSVTFFIGMIELLPEIRMYSSVLLTTLLSVIYVILLVVGVISAYNVVYLVESRMRMEEVYLPKSMRMTIWGQHRPPFKWIYRFTNDGRFIRVNWQRVWGVLGVWSIIWTLTLIFKLC